VAGGELFDRICDKTTYSEAEARDLVITLLQVLAYLHSKHIAHRDLKPENLLLRNKKNDTDVVLAGIFFMGALTSSSHPHSPHARPRRSAAEAQRTVFLGTHPFYQARVFFFFVSVYVCLTPFTPRGAPYNRS
jgi:serine/threonine protein kinase